MRACEDQRIEHGLQAIFATANGTPSEAPTASARCIPFAEGHRYEDDRTFGQGDVQIEVFR